MERRYGGITLGGIIVLIGILLIFIWRLAASRELMGEYRNGRGFNVIAGFTVVATSTLSILLLAITFVSIA